MLLLVSDANILIARYRRPSTNDCFALALARQEQCPMLTGDQSLRNAALDEKLDVMGTLWVVEKMVMEGVTNAERAEQAYDAMKAAGRRLPWTTAKMRLTAL